MARPRVYFERLYLDDGDYRYSEGQMEPGDSKCFVYFLQRGPGGPVKIGYSIALKKRIRALQTASAEKLELLCALEGDWATEAAFHLQFKGERLKGEWFKPEKVLAYLKRDFECSPTL